MRTTLTIDPDVAAVLQRLRRTRDAKLKDLINDALRRGLKEMNDRSKGRTPFRTQTVDLGRPKIGSVANIAEVLAIAEGEGFK
jgi:hypothetical protein